MYRNKSDFRFFKRCWVLARSKYTEGSLCLCYDLHTKTMSNEGLARQFIHYIWNLTALNWILTTKVSEYFQYVKMLYMIIDFGVLPVYSGIIAPKKLNIQLEGRYFFWNEKKHTHKLVLRQNHWRHLIFCLSLITQWTYFTEFFLW